VLVASRGPPGRGRLVARYQVVSDHQAFYLGYHETGKTSPTSGRPLQELS
jgi:hypothetical protein